MADQLSMVRNLIYDLCARRKSFRMGTGRLNHSAIARKMNVHVSTVNRVLNQDPGRRPGSAPKDWYPDESTLDGLMRLGGYVSRSELWEALETAPSAPAPTPTKRKGAQRSRLH